MKEAIHPNWFAEATITCACGNSWTTGATVDNIKIDVCSACHPFFTGERRIVDTEGQVDRFYKRLQVRDVIQAGAEARDAERTSPDVDLADLGLGTRYINVLTQNNMNIVGDVLTVLNESGDQGLLDLQGFGRKALADLKKRLRERGYEVPDVTLD